jgi:hypothetical protein
MCVIKAFFVNMHITLSISRYLFISVVKAEFFSLFENCSKKPRLPPPFRPSANTGRIAISQYTMRKKIVRQEERDVANLPMVVCPNGGGRGGLEQRNRYSKALAYNLFYLWCDCIIEYLQYMLYGDCVINTRVLYIA